jgi:hypothetical protein
MRCVLMKIRGLGGPSKTVGGHSKDVGGYSKGVGGHSKSLTLPRQAAQEQAPKTTLLRGLPSPLLNQPSPVTAGRPRCSHDYRCPY